MFDCARETEHTAISGQRSEKRVALVAFIEMLASVCWHRLFFLVAAMRTGDHRDKLYHVLFHLIVLVSHLAATVSKGANNSCAARSTIAIPLISVSRRGITAIGS